MMLADEILGPSTIYGLSELISSFPPPAVARRDFLREETDLLHGNRTSEILELTKTWGIVFEDAKNVLHLTATGAQLMKLGRVDLAREIILIFLDFHKPRWSKLIHRGRKECIPNLPARVSQCFLEAQLDVDPPDEFVAAWWRRASRITRAIGNEIANEVGDRGESLVLNIERIRTNCEPRHIALETGWAGYDILSLIEEGSFSPLRIEVKASTQKKSEAHFFISSNEWRIAESTGAHLFYLCLLSEEGPARVARIDAPQLSAHIPGNRGSGKWEKTKVPFNLFSFHEVDRLFKLRSV